MSFGAWAQETSLNPNPNSAHPIDEADIQYRAQIWRRMDLNEKINQPFFAENNQISKFLIDGVKAGVLTPYSNDSLNTKLSLEQFLDRLKLKGKLENGGLTAEEIAAGFGGDAKPASAPATGGADDGWGTKKTETSNAEKPAVDDFDKGPIVAGVEYYIPKQLSILEIKEDAIIDRKRSRLYFDIQAITLKIPASASDAGLEDAVASFRFKDVYKFFKNNPNCIWFNSTNEMQHRNMADAFDLRFFSARIIKKGNAANKDIFDQFPNEKEALKKSQKLEQQLQDKEAEMWEN
ncbi:gliding motility protein GldN [Aquirufa antheringensis]|nr:gliding motility protein GldN [Pseudarcicella sp. GAP-15]MCZ2477306.1 gliding motility protein GldN [Aquirufa antheringensis]TBH70703.1 gliding motility protein GldN [Aquirufa antheringensis]